MSEEKKGFFARLKSGLTKTRENFVKKVDNLFTKSEIDDDFYEELEEILVMGDMGINTCEEIIDELKVRVKKESIKDASLCRNILIQSIKDKMKTPEDAYDFEKDKCIILVIGVNGVGKTTTIGKLASKYRSEGRKVLIAAADTFRAAATEQLEEWAKRASVDIISAKEGADPSSVVYDAVASAKSKNVDCLLIDTAGRLHNKKNLMEELKKMNRIIDSSFPDAKRENFIVLDGTTGQNALIQAREFADAADLTGIIITKLDGTAKGGIAVAIQSELNIPVKYIGVGESVDDLQKFDSNAFVDALFDVTIDSEDERTEQ
ncbi:MAG: signal recognition particle-docking protein FtsY [Lachnospiraceae bacterium]|nr:signal recognition particle-docking protein FtsY [Lachnospiraceae bacterium]